VKVRCPDFPITEIGNTIPNINPRYRTEQIPETHIPATKNIIRGMGIMNLFDLTGKKAIVTGAGGNLRPVWMQTLGDAGALPSRSTSHSFDVTKTTLTLSEPIDILITMLQSTNPPAVTHLLGSFNEIMRVNIGGAVRMCEMVIPQIDR